MTLGIPKCLVAGVGIIILLTIAGRIYQKTSEARDLERYPPPGEMIDVEGHLMHINCMGQGSPTLILELGVGSASFSWYDIHKRLSAITRTCAYDRPGLGYSERTNQPKRSSDVAERLYELLRNAGVADELVLVGWSAGGIYVREFYRRYPQRVVGMLLVDSSHEQQARRLPEESGGGADPALRIAKHLAPFGLVRLSGLLEQRVASSRASDEAKAYLRATYHLSHVLDAISQESDAVDLDMNAVQPPPDLGDLPLIVLAAGETGQTARIRMQRELAALSTNGRLAVVENSGHNMHADQPQLIVDAAKELVLRAQSIRTD